MNLPAEVSLFKQEGKIQNNFVFKALKYFSVALLYVRIEIKVQRFNKPYLM